MIMIPTTVQQDLPKEGWHNAEIVEVYEFSQYEDANGKMIKDADLETYQGPKKMKDKLKIIFEVDEVGENGMKIQVKSKPMNQTLGMKSSLRAFLDMIDDSILKTNANFTEDLILGKRVKIKLDHYTSPTNGRTYANIKQIVEDAKPKVTEDDIPSFDRG